MYIFAGSPDALAGQRNYYDSTNVRLAEADRALRQQALDDERKTYLFQQQQADQRERENQEDAMRFTLALMGNQQRNAELGHDEARRQYEFGVGQANLKAQDEESKRRFGIETGLKEKEIAGRNQQISQQNSAKDFAELATAISNGEITDEKQIDSLYPHLDDTARNRGKAYLAAARKGLTTNWDEINNMAGAATALVAPTPVAPKPVSHLFGLYHTQPPTPDKVKLSEDEALAKLMQSNSKSMLQYAPMMQWDEALQRFSPILPKPAFNFGATNAPAPLPAPVAPSAAVVPTAAATLTNNPPPMPLRNMPAMSIPQINWAAPPAPTNRPMPQMAPMTAPPVVPAANGYRLRVKSPTGQFGRIPASQLDAALKQGYTLAE